MILKRETFKQSLLKKMIEKYGKMAERDRVRSYRRESSEDEEADEEDDEDEVDEEEDENNAIFQEQAALVAYPG